MPADPTLTAVIWVACKDGVVPGAVAAAAVVVLAAAAAGEVPPFIRAGAT
jgi:hypothetical protein